MPALSKHDTAELGLPKLKAAPAKKYKLLADGDSRGLTHLLGQDVLDYLNQLFSPSSDQTGSRRLDVERVGVTAQAIFC